MFAKAHKWRPPLASEGSFIWRLSIGSNTESQQKISSVARQPHHSWMRWIYYFTPPLLQVRENRPDLPFDLSHADFTNVTIRLMVFWQIFRLISSFTFFFKAMMAFSLSPFKQTSLTPVSDKQRFGHSTANNSVHFAGTTLAQYLPVL